MECSKNLEQKVSLIEQQMHQVLCTMDSIQDRVQRQTLMHEVYPALFTAIDEILMQLESEKSCGRGQPVRHGHWEWHED